ncbi:MAG: carboxypeptidase regulatory-like domain-containing protein, partial [Acidobacteriota bacterium]|nr:carboxypeptidase regulatory-like domain-containing protein [Acidobacteriota bacterium]
YVHDAFVGDSFAYFSEINNGRHEILDASDPSALGVLSGWNTPGSTTHNSWPNPDHTIVTTTDETTNGHAAVYDIENKTQPGILLSEYNPVPGSIIHNVMVDDDDGARVAISYYAQGFKLIDIHRPTAPVELGSYDTYPSADTGGAGAWGVYAFDPRGYFYVSDMSTGLYVIEYVPTGGVLSGEVRDAVSGEPVPGASVVHLFSGDQRVSGADGVYAFYVPEGPAAIRVTAPGYQNRVVSPGDMALDGRVDVDVHLTPQPKVSLAGTVRRSSDSAPIAGALVSVIGTGQQTTTAGDGSYLFNEVSIGQRIVTAEAFGFAAKDERILLLNGIPAMADFDLDEGRLGDDVEADQAWKHGLSEDTAQSGAWERADPNGTGDGTVQPEDDHTPDPGVTAFITGQSPPDAGIEDNDVDAGFTTLRSPLIDATGLDAALLRYYRWVSTDAGLFFGGSLEVEVSADDGASWSTLELVTDTENSWTRREFDLGSVVELTDEMRVRFRATSPTLDPEL